ncbi:MAG: phosphoribosylamine--glycine ligase [Candidatus Poribacteria bacterium]|nr:phosphoribosylamine--glycine ligase [Candidatus Poribacteria bacterium]
MNILVVGSGGREHAFAWKLAQSPLCGALYVVPGNPGMDALAERHDIPLADDFSALIRFVKEKEIELTVVGPEAPLAAGVVDAMEAEGLRVFGPRQEAARLESSKTFAKRLMEKAGVPTARYAAFDDPGAAKAHLEKTGAPVVVKADGLAAGKGVAVCHTVEQARAAIDRSMTEKAFGEAGSAVVIEEFLEGEEASFTVLCDGITALPMASSQDHKPIYDGGKGPNTGGMGAYSPAPVVTQETHDCVMKRIVSPTLRAMAEAGTAYKGILYVGLMIGAEGPKVVEYNCRLGDPEAQVLLTRLSSDLVPLLNAGLDGSLSQQTAEWREETSVCVVIASGGYPGSYQTGYPIEGIEKAESQTGAVVFHAGTARKDGVLTTSGGRVLGVTALGGGIREAAERAYSAAETISFQNMYKRSDIGFRALARLA